VRASVPARVFGRTALRHPATFGFSPGRGSDQTAPRQPT
jgi:hypothetical protein